MPRKNSDDSVVVAALLQAQRWFSGWQLQPIDQCSQEEVADILQASLLFLSFGHPEVLDFRLQKPLPVDVLSWAIPDWGA